MEAWQLWWEMACESEAAARQAEADGHLRSSASRYYYAAYQAVTALLLYRGMTPPAEREAWGHIETPPLLRDYLRSLIRLRDKRSDLAARLVDLYRLRLAADYESHSLVDAAKITRAARDAGYILKITGGILPKG